MKKFSIKITEYHESFNGYTLCDGDSIYIIESRNSESAINKLRKKFEKEHTPSLQSCWYNVKEVVEIHE